VSDALAAALTRLRRPLRARPRRVLSPFEFWPDWAMYGPVVLLWLALGLRRRGFTVPTAANPGIASGGLCGESKSQILSLAGPRAGALIPAWTTFAATGATAADAAAADAAARRAGLRFPLVIKPDIGCNGTGVRLVAAAADLPRALAGYPVGALLVLQELVPWEGEAGLFYVRRPGEAQGRLTSLTLKEAPYVIGDGRSSLRSLVLRDPRAGRVPHLYLPRLRERLGEVPRQGERVRLVFSGNHCKGSIFRDGRADLTPTLEAAVDAFARDLKGFHFGRIDVRYESLAALRRGEGFRVIEVNGVGSEATHIWDPECSLREAYTAQFRHYAEAFRIGAAMRARGHRPTRLLDLWRLWRLQKRLLASYPMND
jgi:hypothetical protein